MRRTFLMVVLAAALVPWWAAAEDRPAAAPVEVTGRDVQDLVFLAPKGPVLIRLHLRVDDRPFRDAFETAWGDYLTALFRTLDRDGDGSLSPEEAARAPAPPLLLSGTDPADPVHFAFNFAVLDANGDGKVTSEELATYYRDYGGGAVQVQVAARTTPMSRAGDLLFQRLDRDRDGKLSRDELAGAPGLMALDQNGDELLTPEELVGGASPGTPVPAPAASPAAESNFFVVGGTEAPSELAERIAKRYGPGDGKTAAWADLARRPADVEMIVRLGRTAPGEPALTVLRPDKPSAEVSVRQTAEGVAIRVEDALIELVCNRSKLRTLPADPRSYRDLFRAALPAGKDSLDRQAAQRYPFLATWFDLIDRAGTGKVDEKAFETYLTELHERLARALACRTALLISEEGQGLFDLLDQNRDGRLGLRELRDAPKLWQRLNRGPQDLLAPSDLPRSYRLALGLGQASFARHGGNLVVLPPADRAALAAARLGVGPLWFRKMDRNHDGDLSPNEFLGTPEEFRRLDADGDGLISVDEAEQADARLRRTAPPGR